MGSKPLRILFFLSAFHHDRVFECFLRELLSRGHSVRVLVDGARTEPPAGGGDILRALTAEFDGRMSWEALPTRATPRDVVARLLRRLLDYLRYLAPEYAGADALKERSRGRLPSTLAAALDVGARLPGGRNASARLLRSLERGLPVPDSLVDRIRQEDPDVVLVAPLVALGSPQADVLRAAERLELPTVLPVASWDNLTNKGLVRDAPTRTIVWNDDQVAEAVDLHGLPHDRVHAVGAHAYDHWFTWQSKTTGAQFAEKIGLDPARPFLLYVCSSAFVAGDETSFVREWLERLRGAGGRLAEVGVLVRPHPQNRRIWDGANLGDERAVVWPLAGGTPIEERAKADYFDSLHHAFAVAGINTSALIEAAIARRPLFTVATDRYRATQSGTLHFAYLSEGVLNVAETWEQHLEQLEAACADPGLHTKRTEAFLRRFVRPHGLDRPAAPFAADVVERAASERSASPPSSRAARSVVRVLVAAAHAHAAARARLVRGGSAA